jgi:hypothetical protein
MAAAAAAKAPSAAQQRSREAVAAVVAVALECRLARREQKGTQGGKVGDLGAKKPSLRKELWEAKGCTATRWAVKG